MNVQRRFCQGIAAAIAGGLILLAPVKSGAQPVLNGTYDSDGHGTIAGLAVSEIGRWVFVNGHLQLHTERISFDAGIPGVDGSYTVSGVPVNANEEYSAACQFTSSSDPTPLAYSTNVMAPSPWPSFTMTGVGGCPFPHSLTNSLTEYYTILPTNGGADFNYLKWGEFTYDPGSVSISGHGQRE